MDRSMCRCTERPQAGILSRTPHGTIRLLTALLALFLMASCGTYQSALKHDLDANKHEKSGFALWKEKRYAAAAREFEQAAEETLSALNDCRGLFSDCSLDADGVATHRRAAANMFARQAICLLVIGDLQGTQRALDKSFKYDAGIALAHDVQGFVHLSNGDIASAKKEAAILRDIDPGLASSLEKEIGRLTEAPPAGKTPGGRTSVGGKKTSGGQAAPGGQTPNLRDMLLK